MNAWPGTMVRRKTGPKANPISAKAIGTRYPNRKKVGVRCSFDPDQMEEIADIANRYNTSFAGAVRLLVEWGLESAE